jgi:hypothetical protein
MDLERASRASFGQAYGSTFKQASIASRRHASTEAGLELTLRSDQPMGASCLLDLLNYKILVCTNCFIPRFDLGLLVQQPQVMQTEAVA